MIKNRYKSNKNTTSFFLINIIGVKINDFN